MAAVAVSSASSCGSFTDPVADAAASAQYRNTTRHQCLAEWFKGQTPQMQRKLRTHLSSADSHHVIIKFTGVTVGDLTYVLSKLPSDIPSAVTRTHRRVGAAAVFE